MSPFWKNVNEELRYQGMNIKTLSELTGVPYTTITNARNRENSIPTADVALKISKVLNKSLESLLEESAVLPKEKISQKEQSLYKKYENLILLLEKNSPRTQKAFTELAEAIRSETE